MAWHECLTFLNAARLQRVYGRAFAVGLVSDVETHRIADTIYYAVLQISAKCLERPPMGTADGNTTIIDADAVTEWPTP